MDENNLMECYHDAVQYKIEALNLFNLGYLSLPERAMMEQLFWKIMRQLLPRCQAAGIHSPDLEKLEYLLADTYFANFSVFQSLPDSWAIDQVFPIVPIHRLNEKPDKKAVIADLTCDSDGIINDYIGEHDDNVYVPLHGLDGSESYYIGVFMIGAYQETLGELHNLFGDTHAVQIKILGENQYKVRGLIKGDSVQRVLSFVSYSAEELIDKMRIQMETALENRRLSLDESAQLMEQFESGLQGYSYFEE